MEHRDELGRRQRVGPGEERARERLEQHRLGAVGHAEVGEEPCGGHVVERGGGGRGVVGEELGGQGLVRAHEVAQAEAGGAGEEREQVERRRAGQAGEVLRRPAARDHRIAADRAQERQARVGAPQDGPPRVVVPEERVEPVLDDLRGAVGQGVRPRAEPAAERRRRLQQRDGHAAFGQHHRGAHAGDAAADHHGLGAGRHGRRDGGDRRPPGAGAACAVARRALSGPPADPTVAQPSAGYGAGAVTSQRKQSSTRTRSAAGAAPRAADQGERHDGGDDDQPRRDQHATCGSPRRARPGRRRQPPAMPAIPGMIATASSPAARATALLTPGRRSGEPVGRRVEHGGGERRDRERHARPEHDHRGQHVGEPRRAGPDAQQEQQPARRRPVARRSSASAVRCARPARPPAPRTAT